MMIQVNSATDNGCKPSFRAQASCCATSARQGVSKQRKTVRVMGELSAEKKVVLMALTSGGRLMMRIEIGVQAQPFVEGLACRDFPAACPFLQITMKQGISCKYLSDPVFFRAQVAGYRNTNDEKTDLGKMADSHRKTLRVSFSLSVRIQARPVRERSLHQRSRRCGWRQHRALHWHWRRCEFRQKLLRRPDCQQHRA